MARSAYFFGGVFCFSAVFLAASGKNHAMDRQDNQPPLPCFPGGADNCGAFIPGARISEVEPVDGYKNGAFFSSFIEGYGTMDAIAGLAFGIVVIDVIRRMGVNDDNAVARDVLGSGVLTGALMAIIYVLTILMGTQSRGLFELSENGGIALTQIAGHYLGNAGNITLRLQ